VQRLRLRYAKRGVARFASHRDFTRAFERALRRAEIPMAYSSGFSPHPRISYLNAAPTGAASLAEYAEIGLSALREPEVVRQALNAVLPSGFQVVAVVEAAGPYAELLTHSAWLIETDSDQAVPAAEALLDSASVVVSREKKDGVREFDIRPALVQATGHILAEGGSAAPLTAIEAVIAAGSPSVRPDDVVAGMRSVHPAFEPGLTRFTRLAQGPWDGEAVVNCFGPEMPA
jgi:radical SAM-linked protein